MSGMFSASLAAYIPNVTFSRILIITKRCKNDIWVLPLPPVYHLQKETKGQKQVKEKVFTKIEDVGLL